MGSVTVRHCLLGIAAVLGCAGVHDDDALHVLDSAPPPRSTATVPTVRPDHADAAAPDPRPSCAEIVDALNLASQAHEDAHMVCRADMHYGFGVGMNARTPDVRMGYECLLESGHASVVFALADAREPWIRAYAYEAMTTRDAWSLPRLAQALDDSEMTDGQSGCVVQEMALQHYGVEAALAFTDRDAVGPLLARWASRASPEQLAPALARRGEESWVPVERARALFDDSALAPEVRAAAAVALAHRGLTSDTDLLLAWAQSSAGAGEFYATRALDIAGHADAWPVLTRDRTWHTPEVLVLGAHWAPDEAVRLIDAETSFDPAPILELPSRLRDARLATAVCVAGDSPEFGPAIVDALMHTAPQTRCKAFDSARTPCNEARMRQHAYRLSPSLAAACGVEAPEAAPPEPQRCHREQGFPIDRRTDEERARLLELERRAKRRALRD